MFLWYNKLYRDGALNPKLAEEWWTDYREQLAKLGIDLEPSLIGAAAEEPQSAEAPDSGSGNDDDEFDRLLDEFISRELNETGEEKLA